MNNASEAVLYRIHQLRICSSAAYTADKRPASNEMATAWGNHLRTCCDAVKPKADSTRLSS